MIHVFGSINIDYSVKTAHLPKPGETVAGQSLILTPGGKGANQALAARRAGAMVSMHGATGSDSVADNALSLLTADGVDLSRVKKVAGPTGCAFVFVDDNSENQIVIISGANAEVTPADASSISYRKDDILLLQLECPIESVITAASHAKKNKAKVILNTAPYQSIDKAVFKTIDYLIINETEAQLLASDLKLSDNRAKTIAAATGCSVIKTLGENGVEAVDERSEVFALPGINVDAVDTVGAGDTFAGFLGAMLGTTDSLQNACKVANAAAALACTKPGAQSAIPTLSDVKHLAGSKQ